MTCDISKDEKVVIDHLTKICDWRDIELVRKSPARFDIGIQGQKFWSDGTSTLFGANLKLALIREAEWPDYSDLCDPGYAEMVEAGDWSGIRDSDQPYVDAMFARALVENGLDGKLEKPFRA